MTTPPIADHLVRTLRYLDLADGAGVTTGQLNDYATLPEPRVARQVDRMQSLGVYQFPWITYEAGEEVHLYMIKVGWVDMTSDGTWVLSRLGKAIVESLNRSDGTEDSSDEGVIVMSPEDPMRYSLLTRKLADADLLVDPYFKAEQLDWVSTATSIGRVLMGIKGARRGEEAAISMALGAMRELGRGIPEVRISSDPAMHDRAILHSATSVALLGTSLTGLAKHLSVYTPLPQEASTAFGATIEDWWSTAKIIEPRDGVAAPKEEVKA